jgi:hypothetical protein
MIVTTHKEVDMCKKITLEVLIATPPTTKCEQTIKVLEDVVQHYPEETSLLIFRRGIDFVPPPMQVKTDLVSEEDLIPKQASVQMRALISKSRAIPTVVVDGVFFSNADVPNLDDLLAKVKEILSA